MKEDNNWYEEYLKTKEEKNRFITINRFVLHIYTKIYSK